MIKNFKNTSNYEQYMLDDLKKDKNKKIIIVKDRRYVSYNDLIIYLKSNNALVGKTYISTGLYFNCDLEKINEDYSYYFILENFKYGSNVKDNLEYIKFILNNKTNVYIYLKFNDNIEKLIPYINKHFPEELL